jgi:hypothetical protein
MSLTASKGGGMLEIKSRAFTLVRHDPGIGNASEQNSGGQYRMAMPMCSPSSSDIDVTLILTSLS